MKNPLKKEMDFFLLIVILHVVAIVPFLLWIGFNRAATPDWVYPVLFGLGLLVLVYHGYKAVGRYFAKSPLLWVNAIHVLFIAPLLLWIGYYAKKTEKPAYDMLLLAAFGAFGFHLYKLVVITQTFVKPAEI
jgi:CDP-diglyceride synthetase